MTGRFKDKIQQAKVAAGILNRDVYTGPWNVQIDLTNQCNNDCIACWCNSPLIGDKAMAAETKMKSLTYDQTINLVDDLDDLGVRTIYFTGGGEPIMHPRILDIMRHIKDKGIHLDMSTNFTLVNKETADKLIDMKVDHITLSLWAGIPETYAKLHPNKDAKTFLEMTEVIDYIVEHKRKKGTTRPALGMYNVISIYNFQEVDKMLEFAFRHKMDDIIFTPVDTVPERTDHLKLNTEQRKELVKKIKKMPEQTPALEKKFHHHLHFRDYDSFLRRMENTDAEMANYDSNVLDLFPTCYAGWSFARVLATGEVNSCLKSFKIPIGNINEESFKSIWFGDKQKEFRKHTIEYDKNDPYFNSMGNDRATEVQGCAKCCDNLGINTSIHQKLSKLNIGKKLALKIAGKLWKLEKLVSGSYT